MPAQPDPYLAAWAKLRRQRVRAWLTVALAPASWLACASLDRIVGPGGRSSIVYGWTVFLACWMALLFCNLRFLCPHCRRSFFRRRAPRDRCARCGIRVGTPKAAVARDFD